MENNNTALTGVRMMIADGIVTQEAAEKYFPDLKKSEDEKWIPKEIAKYLKEKGGFRSCWLAWLEKQGNNHAPINIDKMVMEYSQTKDSDFGMPANCMIRAYRQGIIDVLNLSSGIEKQGEQNHANSTKTCEDEQNPTDKIKPKFKAGDRIIGIFSGIQYYISRVCNDYYFTETGTCIMFNAQNNFKLYDQKPVDSYCQENCKGFKETGKCFADEDCKAKREAESINKVEPKFHKGEWVIFNEHHNSVYQVEKIQGLRYYLRHYLGGTLSVRFDTELIRLWTLQDAKSGDVLASNSSTFLFSQEYMAGKPEAHCGIMNGFFIAKPEGCWTNEKIYPATKEQRYFLFTKMREAGYEWDADRKELKKIEQSKLTAFEEAVKDMMDDYRDAIDDNKVTTEEVKERAAYMLSLIPPKPAEWSEEDEKMLDTLIADYEFLSKKYRDQEHDFFVEISLAKDDLDMISWLKSLKERVACEANRTTTKQWKPSEEQIKVLEFFIPYVTKCSVVLQKSKDTLLSLLSDLKKLREE